MEKIIETYSHNQTLTYAGPNLKISLNIDKLEYDIPVDALFDIAVRDNPKRRFLFVSKVLGKHIPIRPLTLKVIGALLSCLWYEKNRNINCKDRAVVLTDALVKLQSPDLTIDDYDNLKASVDCLLHTPLKLHEHTLFIGFAETATGIAQAVFDNFSNASYIHTTRETLKGIEPNFVFSEEHSHAVEHALYTKDKDFLEQFDRIVLIDDELTTGKTAINLMKNLPGKSFGLISILDWRNRENLEMFEKTRDISIQVCSLLKGTITNIENISTPKEDYVIDCSKASSKLEAEHSFQHHKIIRFSNHSSHNGYLHHTGRFGLSASASKETNSFIKQAAKVIGAMKEEGPCLCLGTEEFIYIPCRIAEELGSDVFFHSTTRSPIISTGADNYCIKNKVRFHSPFKENVMNHIYNIPFDHYKQVFLFTEKPLSDDDTAMFNKIMRTFQITNITFVSWK